MRYAEFSESIDSAPVAWARVQPDFYRFDIDDKVYVVRFMRPAYESRPTQVDFGMATSNSEVTFNITGERVQYKVLATVLNIIMDYAATEHPSGISFSARKGVKANDSKSRVSVYDRLVRKFIPAGWAYSSKDIGNEVKFFVI